MITIPQCSHNGKAQLTPDQQLILALGFGFLAGHFIATPEAFPVFMEWVRRHDNAMPYISKNFTRGDAIKSTAVLGTGLCALLDIEMTKDGGA